MPGETTSEDTERLRYDANLEVSHASASWRFFSETMTTILCTLTCSKNHAMRKRTGNLLAVTVDLSRFVLCWSGGKSLRVFLLANEYIEHTKANGFFSSRVPSCREVYLHWLRYSAHVFCHSRDMLFMLLLYCYDGLGSLASDVSHILRTSKAHPSFPYYAVANR